VPTFVKLNANRLHWLSSAGIALARALNDTPKIVAIAAIAMLAEGVNLAGFKNLIFVGMAVAMTVGSLAGIVVARKMGEKVTRLTEVDGFIANLVTAVLVGGAANMGLPVSTTHVSNGSIVGVGLRRGAGGVSWKTIRDFVLAWIITLPAGAVLALVAYYVIHLFLR
jgi:PiT family inorganic phosphate transporter